MKKKEGSMVYMMAIITLIFSVGWAFSNMRLENAKVIHNHIDGALVAANLAAELVDLDKYAESRNISIKNPNESYTAFEKSLNYNVGDVNVVDNRVNVENFTIYEVLGKDIKVISVKPYYSEKLIKDGLNKTKTPSGVTIKSTSIYSKVSYKVKSLVGERNVYNQCTTDVKGK